MREWPSIVPAFAETDVDRANYETYHRRSDAGQQSDPLRVIMSNTDTDLAEDASHAIAQELLRRLGLEGRNVPSVLEDFIDCNVGKDRQLTPAAGPDITSAAASDRISLTSAPAVPSNPKRYRRIYR